MIRRDFMAGLLAACTAPAIVCAESIMVVRRPIEMPGDRWRLSISGVRLIAVTGREPHGYPDGDWASQCAAGIRLRSMEITKNRIHASV